MKTIIVADKDPGLLKQVESWLFPYKFNLLVAYDAEMAFNLYLSQAKVDIIICEFHMPDFDAQKLYEELPSQAKDIPFLIMHLETPPSLNITHHLCLSKPLTKQVLIDQIKKLCGDNFFDMVSFPDGWRPS